MRGRQIDRPDQTDTKRHKEIHVMSMDTLFLSLSLSHTRARMHACTHAHTHTHTHTEEQWTGRACSCQNSKALFTQSLPQDILEAHTACTKTAKNPTPFYAQSLQ